MTKKRELVSLVSLLLLGFGLLAGCKTTGAPRQTTKTPGTTETTKADVTTETTEAAGASETKEAGGDMKAVEGVLVSAAGVFVSTFAGSKPDWEGFDDGPGAWEGGFADGPGDKAEFAAPAGLALDAEGNLYVADVHNHRIRKITPQGVVRSLAGSSRSGYVDGLGDMARFDRPSGIALDKEGNLYVTDEYNHRIRKIAPWGGVRTLAGDGKTGEEAGGFADGPIGGARFDKPFGIAIDKTGNLYVGDVHNHRIRKITPQGVVSTLAGSGESGYADGPESAAQFYFISGIAVDKAGNLYVADNWNHRIRKITPQGVVSTLAGSGETGKDGCGYADGPKEKARFCFPSGIAVDKAGNLYVADFGNNRIRTITPQGEVGTLAGSGGAGVDEDGFVGGGHADGPGNYAEFDGPSGLAFDAEGNLYVTDRKNHRIRKIEMRD